MIETTPSVEVIAGKFFFSKRRRKSHDNEGRPRIFCKLLPSGKIVEYTEVLTVEMLAFNPGIEPLDSDAEFLGEGFYHHREG